MMSEGGSKSKPKVSMKKATGLKNSKISNKRSHQRKTPFNEDVDTRDKYSLVKTGAEKLSDFVKYEAGVVRKVVKGAFDLVSVKHVSYYQILGKWNIYQDVELKGGAVFSYPVSVELHEDGSVTSRYNDEVHNSTFKFVERQWPKKCSVEFEIRSFKAEEQEEPVPVLYKGYFKRSLLNSHIVFMKGKLFQTTGKAL